MRYALLLLLLILTGCGYHFAGQGGELPGGVKKLYLPLFTNRTAEPRLENRLASDLSLVFGRNSAISQVEQREAAEAMLEGVISGYSTRAISYDRNDDISEYRATMNVEVKLRAVADGRLLWQGPVSWSDEYLAADDKNLQADYEREAKEEISLRISEEILSRLLDDF